MDEQNWVWNMDGKYRVYSLDRTQWVDIDFTEDSAKIASNGQLEIVRDYG